MVSLISYALMTVATTLFVGHLGAAALAAVGIGTTAAFTLLCFGFGLLRGVKTLSAQAKGAGHSDQGGALLGAGLVSGLSLGFLVIGLGLVLARWLPRLSASAEAGNLAATFLRIRLLSAPALLAFVALREYRYGLADSRGPMVASVSSNLVAIALNWVLISKLELGVAGAAWSTVLAELIGCSILTAVQAREGFGGLRLDPRTLRSLISVGAPTGIQFALDTLQMIHFAFLPAVGLGEAASVLVGEAVGAHRDDLVMPIARLAAKLAAGYAVFCTIVMAVGGELLTGAFTTDPMVAHQARQIGWVACAFLVADAINVVARGALRGTGDVRRPAFIGIVTSWLATPPLAWLLGHAMGFGAVGAWVGLAVEIIVGAVILWRRLALGAWSHEAHASRKRLADASEGALATVEA
ncbi:MAG: polysaccharide biosynthesis C-terminal domain-containing protein [Deltaproteobacteria bacterium]|nr:polysaccharide biosynthesis C-terminal domain-containing protein [Deltaproteobacteria bacterium]